MGLLVKPKMSSSLISYLPAQITIYQRQNTTNPFPLEQVDLFLTFGRMSSLQAYLLLKTWHQSSSLLLIRPQAILLRKALFITWDCLKPKTTHLLRRTNCFPSTQVSFPSTLHRTPLKTPTNAINGIAYKLKKKRGLYLVSRNVSKHKLTDNQSPRQREGCDLPRT